VLSIVYTLFVRTTIGGHGNALLDHQLFSAPLGGSFLQIGADGSGGILVYLAIFTVLAVVAGISRRIALRLQLAAALYLAASATWTLGERTLFRRWYRGGPERSAEALSTPLR
jgi:YidC/Oxa1 family membrane protein insertase